ncbi:MAG TPA: heterodisulfide reductase-related iron-sulfur binding cluster [Anaerolineales bacterium]|nr:heterodisulfide reductase-related iron-sulfur binding cluster [Anaerolineales bacterium]
MTTQSTSATRNNAKIPTVELAEKVKNTVLQGRDFLYHAILQLRILKKAYPGIMHALIFWGVTIQVVGTFINLMQMQLFIPLVELPFPRGSGYLAYELIMEMAGVAILLGVTMAAFRRVIVRPETLETRWDDLYALGLLGLIPVAGFTLESLRILSTAPIWANWSPIGSALASLWGSLGLTSEAASKFHPYLFWTHISLGLILVASIPFTKLRHLILTPLNVILHPKRKAGVLEKIENIDEAELLGVGRINEFSQEQLLSFDACVRCGRCEEVCPAALSGMSYSPRKLIKSLRETMVTSFSSPSGLNGKELLGDTLPDDYPWACTTCGACLTGCPAFVNPVDEIIDLRRYQALTTGKLPKSVADVLRNMERQGNPWGMLAEDRLAWAEELEIRELAPGDSTDVLLFLGCAFAYDDRNKKVAQAFARVLKRAGVDFAILGLDEGCCGETARRLGHEYLFQMFAEQNIEMLSNVKFNRIVTQCPHCFNTLKNEYPQVGGEFVVKHYTEFLAELTSISALTFDQSNGYHKNNLTYHDSCYLGRYNNIYSEPRSLLKTACVNLVEMSRRNENSFCCGGGGGQMWMETNANTRINHNRLEDARNARADIVATACPYCLLMFDDAIRSKGLSQELQVLDIIEVLDAQLTGEGMTN